VSLDGKRFPDLSRSYQFCVSDACGDTPSQPRSLLEVRRLRPTPAPWRTVVAPSALFLSFTALASQL